MFGEWREGEDPRLDRAGQARAVPMSRVDLSCEGWAGFCFFE